MFERLAAVVAQTWAAHAEALDDEPTPAEPSRALHVSETLDGRRELSGHLDAEGGEVLARALRLAETKDLDGEPERSAPERRADALEDVARFFLDHQRSKVGGRHRPHLNVVVDASDVEGHRGGSVLGGPNLPAETIQRLLCDCALHRVVRSGTGLVLDYGRSARTAPVPLFNALVVRDETCRFPGCDRPPVWCEAHHIWPWEDGGPTDQDNTVLLCTRHHHLLHTPGWSIKLLPSGTVEVTNATGTVRTSNPPRRLRERAGSVGPGP